MVIFITKYGVILARESANTNEKREKVLLKPENEIRRVIFLNASFYSMNANQAENQSFKYHTL